MSLRRILRRLPGDRRASQSLEFMMVSALFFPISFAIVELGLALWTQNAMQMAVTKAARCVAIGSTDCPDVAAYTVSAVNAWLVPDTVSSSDVTVTTNTTCNSAPGKAVQVSMSHALWSSLTLPPPFGAPTLTVSACFPSSAS